MTAGSSDWFDLLTAIITYGHEYLWTLYQDLQTSYGKVVVLGLLGLFTPSQVISNLIVLCYLFLRRPNRGTYIIELLYLVLGKYTGLMVSALFSYNWFFYLSTFITLAIGPLVITFLFSSFYAGRKEILLKRKSVVVPLTIGFLMSYYIDPVLRVITARLPFLSYSNITDVIFPFIYTVMLFLPALIICLVIYGFELDRKLENKQNVKTFIRYFVFALLSLIAINEIVIYWF